MLTSTFRLLSQLASALCYAAHGDNSWGWQPCHQWLYQQLCHFYSLDCGPWLKAPDLVLGRTRSTDGVYWTCWKCWLPTWWAPRQMPQHRDSAGAHQGCDYLGPSMHFFEAHFTRAKCILILLPPKSKILCLYMHRLWCEFLFCLLSQWCRAHYFLMLTRWQTFFF